MILNLVAFLTGSYLGLRLIVSLIFPVCRAALHPADPSRREP